jgi:tRNA-modifying protein YgfZ
MSDHIEQYQTLTSGFGAVALRRDVLRASGSDVAEYLQGQTSQDVDKIAVGSSAWSWILQPHGKVDAFIRMTRTADSDFLIDVDAGFAELVLERLNRFKVRTAVEFEQLPWRVLGLRGAQAVRPNNDVVVEVNWPGMVGFDVFGPAPEPPAGASSIDYDVYEATRIEVGLPQMGNELDQLTIPAEAGINDRTISFTKGCYTGQELTARIDSRGGNVPRNLRVLVIDSDEAPPRGSKVMAVNAAAAAKPMGTITSSAVSPGSGRSVALAFVRREVQPGAQASVLWDEGPSKCVIEKPPVTP